MKKIASTVFILITIILFSQQKEESKGQWVFGGNIGIGGGSYGGFGINIAPEVGYRMNNGFEVGGKVGYNYNTNDYYKSSFFSVGPYVNYTFVQNLFVRAQYEFLFGSSKIKDSANYTLANNGDISESALWLGGGYSNNIGSNVRYNLGLMYNVLYDKETSVYSTGLYPIVGVSFGF